MNSNLVTFQRVDTLKNVATALETTHHSFPVLNEKGNLIGMIPKNFVLVLLHHRAFYINDEELD